MREILFRGKRVDNGEWVYGHYVHQYGADMIYLPDGTDREYGFDYYHIDKETLCEFSGLCDKNGNRIWENDIVHLTDVRYDTEWRAIVEFGNPYGEYTWGWNFYHIGEKAKVNTDILLWAEMEDVEVYCEVIVNSFDNP